MTRFRQERALQPVGAPPCCAVCCALPVPLWASVRALVSDSQVHRGRSCEVQTGEGQTPSARDWEGFPEEVASVEAWSLWAFPRSRTGEGRRQSKAEKALERREG